MNQLYIPQTLIIGFQNRKDTFTGKLAYIIYRDQKNVVRKEKSWEGWRDKNIPTMEIPNTPINGFMINKGILRDGYWSNGHNNIRIYDSRDFEFEISVSNLIHALMHNDVSKRELQGEFVYAWNGTDLVLLSVESIEYQNAQAFTAQQAKKISKKDLKPGYLYRNKKMKEYVYMGYLERYTYANYTLKQKSQGKRHTFYRTNEKFADTTIDSVTLNFNEEVSNEPVDNFADLLARYKNSLTAQRISNIQIVSIDDPQYQDIPVITSGSRWGEYNLVKIKNEFYLIEIRNYYYNTQKIYLSALPDEEKQYIDNNNIYIQYNFLNVGSEIRDYPGIYNYSEFKLTYDNNEWYLTKWKDQGEYELIPVEKSIVLQHGYTSTHQITNRTLNIAGNELVQNSQAEPINIKSIGYHTTARFYAEYVPKNSYKLIITLEDGQIWRGK